MKINEIRTANYIRIRATLMQCLICRLVQKWNVDVPCSDIK